MKWTSYALEWVGYVAISFGCWLAWPPLGFIVGGALLVQASLGPGLLRKSEDESTS